MTLAADAVEAAVRAYYEAVSKGDIEAVAAMFTRDAVMRDPVGAPPATDDAARRLKYTGILVAFDDFTIAPATIIVGGDEAAAAWTVDATSKSGRDVRFSGISTFTLDSTGRITAMSAYLDIAAVAAAMQG
jgi:ketosteroid isomerase-like protein